MKAIFLQRHGRPEAACACLEVEAPGAPGAGEVLVEIEAAAINPADLLIAEGRYPGPETLPAPLGIEGAGLVLSVGDDVEGLAPGDRVMSLGRANWAQQVKGPAAQFIRLPVGLDPKDAAQLKANPPSAWLMLKDYLELRPGDWVIQNAANSAVGRHVIGFARLLGLKSVNLVRRESLVPELKSLGGDLVLLDGPDLAGRVAAEIGSEESPRLAIDAIGGEATERLAACLGEGGKVVNYGFLSGEPCRMTSSQLIVKGLSLHGFWLVGFMRRSQPVEIQALYDEMAGHFMAGRISSPVEASYGLEEIAEALAHAGRESRNGKILLTPNAPLN